MAFSRRERSSTVWAGGLLPPSAFQSRTSEETIRHSHRHCETGLQCCNDVATRHAAGAWRPRLPSLVTCDPARLVPSPSDSQSPLFAPRRLPRRSPDRHACVYAGPRGIRARECVRVATTVLAMRSPPGSHQEARHGWHFGAYLPLAAAVPACRRCGRPQPVPAAAVPVPVPGAYEWPPPRQPINPMHYSQTRR